MAGYGLNQSTTLLSNCTDPNCVDCCSSTSLCTACNTTGGWLLNTVLDQCQHPTLSPQFSAGVGFDNVSGNLLACATAYCQNCSANYQICTACDQANGYVLVNGTCHQLTIITTAVTPTSPNVDLSWRQQLASTPISTLNTTKAYATLIANKQLYNLTAIGSSDLSQYTLTTETYGSYVILDFRLPTGLPQAQYNVTLVGFNYNMTNDDGTVYQIRGAEWHRTVYYQPESTRRLQLPRSLQSPASSLRFYFDVQPWQLLTLQLD